MEMEFTTQLSMDQAVLRLQKAVGPTSNWRKGERLRPHLEGEVTRDKVVLYRHRQRGVSNWFGRFVGRFAEDGAVVKLRGHFVPQPPVFLYLWSGFLILWSIVLVVAVVARWQGPESLAWLVAAVVAATAGLGAFWFRAKNVHAEAAMLLSEIERTLGEPDV